MNDSEVAWQVCTVLRNGTLTLTLPEGEGDAASPVGDYPLALWEVEESPARSTGAPGLSRSRDASAPTPSGEIVLVPTQPLIGTEGDETELAVADDNEPLHWQLLRRSAAWLPQMGADGDGSSTVQRWAGRAAQMLQLGSSNSRSAQTAAGSVQDEEASGVSKPRVTRLVLSFRRRQATSTLETGQLEASIEKAASKRRSMVPELRLDEVLDGVPVPGSAEPQASEVADRWREALQMARVESQQVDAYCMRQTDAKLAHDATVQAASDAARAASADAAASEDDDEGSEGAPGELDAASRWKRDHVVREGYLLRRTLRTMQWAARYFVLTNDGRLAWFFNHHSAAAAQARLARGRTQREGRGRSPAEASAEVLVRFFAVHRLPGVRTDEERQRHAQAFGAVGLHPCPEANGLRDCFEGVDDQCESSPEHMDVETMLPSCTRFELRCGDECVQLAAHGLVAEQWVEALRFQMLLNYHKQPVFIEQRKVKVEWLDGTGRMVPINDRTRVQDVVLSMCRSRFEMKPEHQFKQIEKEIADEWCLCEVQTHRGRELPMHKLRSSDLILGQVLLHWEELMRREYGLASAPPATAQGAFRLLMRRIEHRPPILGATSPRARHSLVQQHLSREGLADVHRLEVAQAKSDCLGGHTLQRSPLRPESVVGEAPDRRGFILLESGAVEAADALEVYELASLLALTVQSSVAKAKMLLAQQSAALSRMMAPEATPFSTSVEMLDAHKLQLGEIQLSKVLPRRLMGIAADEAPISTPLSHRAVALQVCCTQACSPRTGHSPSPDPARMVRAPSN